MQCLLLMPGIHPTSEILHLLSQVKSFILFADISKGVYVLQWKEEGALLTLLSRDPTPQQPTAADFLIDGPNLGLVAGDSTTSMQVGHGGGLRGFCMHMRGLFGQ